MRDYRTQVELAGIGRTPQLCQDALVEMLEELFDGNLYNGQEGRKPVKVYKQDLPIPTEDDEDADTDHAPSPYVLVQMSGGDILSPDGPQIIEFGLTICAYDDDTKREGFQEVANIKEDIIQRVCTRPYFGGAFTILHPMTWKLQIDTTPPYYYGVVILNCTAPALTQDTELEALV